MKIQQADTQTPACNPIPPTESSSAEVSEGNQAPHQPQPQPQPQPPLQLQPQSADENAPEENQTNEVLDVEIDGVYNGNNIGSGVGFIARNEEGVRLACCMAIGADSMEHAEIIAALEAIRTLDWKGYQSLRLFTTCRLIIPGLVADNYWCPEGHEELRELYRIRIYCPNVEFNYRNREDMALATRLAELAHNYVYESNIWDARTATVSFEEWLRQIGVDGQGGQG